MRLQVIWLCCCSSRLLLFCSVRKGCEERSSVNCLWCLFHSSLLAGLSAHTRCRQPILRCTDVSTTLVLGSCFSGFLEQLFPCLCLWRSFHCSSWFFGDGKMKNTPCADALLFSLYQLCPHWCPALLQGRHFHCSWSSLLSFSVPILLPAGRFHQMWWWEWEDLQ